MSARNPYETYRNNAITTAAPGELTLMLYNGCLTFINKAKQAIEKNDMEEKNETLQKAQDIVSELMVTLNMDIPISEQLMQMYDYLYRRLLEANIHSDRAILDEVEEFVLEFRDTWKEVVLQNRQAVHGKGGHA